MTEDIVGETLATICSSTELDAYVGMKGGQTFTDTRATVDATPVSFGTAVFPIAARDTLLSGIDRRHNEIQIVQKDYRQLTRYINGSLQFGTNCHLPDVLH